MVVYHWPLQKLFVIIWASTYNSQITNFHYSPMFFRYFSDFNQIKLFDCFRIIHPVHPLLFKKDRVALILSFSTLPVDSQ